MKNENLSELFKKYLQGECTPEESAFIDNWYQSHEKNPDDDRLLNITERKNLEGKMLERIKSDVGHLLPETKRRSLFFQGTYRVAAAIIVIALIGVSGFLYYQNQSLVVEGEVDAQVIQVNRIANNTKSIARHLLSDGTVINLHPGGSLSFPEIFSAEQREIQLRGEAFFDVAKDKKRPFIINTDEVTIKVLGTSFNVKAYLGSKEVIVAVRTGKVSVYAKNTDPSQTPIKGEIILTPNQEVVYNTEEENFSKKLVEDPQIILEKPTLFEMKYDGTPVDKIFQVLEENYGIDIVFDEQVLAACNLTTSMAEEGLYERIEIICQAIGAQYEISDGIIHIKSTGCQ